MAWVKLDDQFPDHAKLAQCEVFAPLCGWLYVCGLAYCNRQLTDGRIPKGHIHRLVNFRGLQYVSGSVGKGKDALAQFADDIDVDDLAKWLVAVGLWEDNGADYVVHDYLEYQPSSATIKASRTATKQRVSKWQARRNSVSNGVSNGGSNGVSNSVITPAPVPVPVPDPVPQEQDQERVRARDPKTGYVKGHAQIKPASRSGLVNGRAAAMSFKCLAFYVPDFLHADFTDKLTAAGVPDPEADLMAWYGRLRDQQQGQETPADNIKWLRAQYDVWRRPKPVPRVTTPEVDPIAAWADGVVA